MRALLVNLFNKVLTRERVLGAWVYDITPYFNTPGKMFTQFMQRVTPPPVHHHHVPPVSMSKICPRANFELKKNIFQIIFFRMGFFHIHQ